MTGMARRFPANRQEKGFVRRFPGWKFGREDDMKTPSNYRLIRWRRASRFARNG
jgi:hypothetical protein